MPASRRPPEDAPGALLPCQVCYFDGGIPVESWGTCTDFNLMLRKGLCTGKMECLRPAGAQVWMLPQLPEGYSYRDAALYCVQGTLALPGEGLSIQAGELLLCRRMDALEVSLEGSQDAVVMACVMDAH